jgi:hypothetical protein
MIDKKAFLLMILLLSQLAQAQESQPSDVNIERKLVQAVMSEDEVKYLLEKRLLILQEDGTLKINKSAIQATKKNGYSSGIATESSICLEGKEK